MAIIHILPQIDCWKGDTAPAQKKGRKGKCTVPDVEVLDMRYRHEILRQPLFIVEKAYPQYSAHYVRDVIEYKIRAHLRVKPV